MQNLTFEQYPEAKKPTEYGIDPQAKSYPEFHKELITYLVPIFVVFGGSILIVLAIVVGMMNQHKRMLDMYAPPEIVGK
jgi:hypothetical protein